MSGHGHSHREMNLESIAALAGHDDVGKFGRMFPHLQPLHASHDALADLAAAMMDTDDLPGGDNPDIAAGFTYLGQFVDHDITLDTTPIDKQHEDPQSTRNFRTPRLDLDSVYGQGPAISPHLFGRNPATLERLEELLIGKAGESADPAGGQIPELPNDLPRNSVGRALIGDERNDENLLVAQTHLAFLKFHNAVVEHIRNTNPRVPDLFAEARRITTWHYQWIVLFDFVERLTEPGLINRIRHRGRRFYRFKKLPYMPVEFAAAAYRLGHSMVRSQYSHNRVFNSEPGAFAPGSLELLFAFTGKSGSIVGDLVDDPNIGPAPPVGPQRTLPSNWVIDWNRFYDFNAPAVNRSRRLDPQIARPLHTLPGENPPFDSLPFRNLLRGVLVGLPSGQSVARHMRVAELDPEQIAAGPDGEAARAHGLHLDTPLWYYILKEAEQFHEGRRLGPVGSTIVAETFLGLVHGDHNSFLWQRSNWMPELPSAVPGTFAMTDLLNFVGDLNPVG